MEKGRRRHVPAFGEWNYYYHYYDVEPAAAGLPPPSAPPPPAAEWYAAEPEARSDVWFKYSPPPRRPATKKARRAPAPEKALYDGGKGTPRRAGRAYAASPTTHGAAPAKGGACRVVRPVDEDLYQVPPPEFDHHRPRRKRAVRSLWMGCFGLNCVA